MSLRNLELVQFRNLERQDLDFPQAGVVLIGANAQGKSNLLEAIYYLETFRSFRGARDAQLVRFGEDLFRLAAEIADPETDDLTQLTVAYRQSDRTKRVTVDGAAMPRMSEAIGQLGCVVFSPADVQVVSGAPEVRRRFLDMVLSLNQPGYLAALQAYRKALAQRNAALRSGAGSSAVAAWNPSLTEAGAKVANARQAWVTQWNARFAAYYAAVSGGSDAGMEYRSTVGVSGDYSPEGFAEALDQSASWEDRSRTTVVGPHRDELLLRLGQGEGGIDVRAFGSGGQRRTAALALRLVEAAHIRASRGHAPIVLMDDVFAELDAERSDRLVQLIEAEDWGQVMLTAPKESDIRFRSGSLARWRIEGGRIAA